MADTPTPLIIRKVADKSTGERVVRFDPETGEKKLVNPATPGDEHEPWPLAGVEFVYEDGPPAFTRVSTSYVQDAIREGWLEAEGMEPVVRPSGPADNKWAGNPHVFMHIDALVFKTINGDVRYNVVRQPDKYVEGNSYDERGLTTRRVNTDDHEVTDEIYAEGKTRVDWFYDLELEG